MTTVSTAARSDSLLRLAFRVDAVVSGLAGIAILAAAGSVSGSTGYSQALLYGLGAGFVVYAAALLVVARLEPTRLRSAGIAIAVGNTLFTVLTVIVVLARPVDLTTAGVVLTLASGLGTLVFADLQYLGARRIKDQGRTG